MSSGCTLAWWLGVTRMTHRGTGRTHIAQEVAMVIVMAMTSARPNAAPDTYEQRRLVESSNRG